MLISVTPYVMYNRLIEEATQRNAQSSESSTRSSSSSSSGSTASASIVESASNQTMVNDGGYGTTTDQATGAAQDNYVEGYEMTKESTTSDSASSSTSFSGADILGSVLVILAVSVIFIGFRRRRI
ncbi:MAG: hypothetical protein K8R11_10150 [Methanococcoides sp.]|nr:hypothetical protein [Methanococcoides sp.]